MNIFISYYSGLKAAVKNIKAAGIIYTIVLLLALVITIPFHNMLSRQAGSSMALGALVKNFDYTVFSDFMNFAGKMVKAYYREALWMGGLYFLINVFFAGGILSLLAGDKFENTGSSFFRGCGKFFLRYFRMSIYLVIMDIVAGILVFLPLSAILTANYESTTNESSLFYIAIAGAAVFAFLFLLISVIGDYAKVIVFNNDTNKIIKSLFESIKFVFKHFLSVYILYVLIVVVPILLYLGYFVLDDKIGMTSGFTIFLMFIIQQVLMMLRIIIKIWFYGSEIVYFNAVGMKKKNESIEPGTFTGETTGSTDENVQPV